MDQNKLKQLIEDYGWKPEHFYMFYTEKEQLQFVERNALHIRFIENPSRKVIIKAIKTAPSSIRFIKNPSERIQLLAVLINSFCFRYIKNPTEKVKLIAVKYEPHNLTYIDNPSDIIQKTYIENINRASFKHVQLHKFSEENVKKLLSIFTINDILL